MPASVTRSHSVKFKTLNVYIKLQAQDPQHHQKSFASKFSTVFTGEAPGMGFQIMEEPAVK